MARKKTTSLFYFQGIPGLFMLALILASLAGLVIALILLTSGNFDLSAEARARRRQPGMTFCTEQYSPVCGVDGKTYSNQCFAMKAGTTVAYEGTCNGTGRAIPSPIEY